MPARKNRRWLAAAIAMLLLALLLGGDIWTRAYVRLNHQRLEDFAATALEETPPHGIAKYGSWSAFCYPENGMVEFFTGGFGLTPFSVYKGFYYSADDVHIPFQGVDQPMEVNGDDAGWREPESGNWGISRRIAEHWFWYEAHF